MPVGSIENTSGASLTIVGIGWTLPTAHTETINVLSESEHTWVRAAAELSALITAGDIVLRDSNGLVVPAANVTCWAYDTTCDSIINRRKDVFTIDSTDVSNGFVTLSATPTGTNAEDVLLNGSHLSSGGDDYTLSGDVVTFVSGALTVGDLVVVRYYTSGAPTRTKDTFTITAGQESSQIVTLSDTPISDTEKVILNGAELCGGGVDYTLSGMTLTFVVGAITENDFLQVKYEV